MPLPHPGEPLFSNVSLTHHQPLCTQVFSPLLEAGFALLLSYFPVSLPVFLWPTLSETFWGLTFQAPHWVFLIFVYLFSAVSPPLLGCLLACLLDFLILPVSHPFFYNVGVSALLGAGSLPPSSDPSLAFWLLPSLSPVFVVALVQSSLGTRLRRGKMMPDSTTGRKRLRGPGSWPPLV